MRTERIPFDSDPSKERPSRVILRFCRHSEKEKADKPDKDIQLTPPGRKQAVARSEKGDMRQRVAFGSSKDRTRHTAGLVMAGAEEEITGDETLEELEQKLDKGLRVGSKLGVDLRLDYVDDGVGPVSRRGAEAYAKKRYLDFLVHESDQYAAETGDNGFTTYTYLAADIAKIIEKYLRVASRWNEIVQDSDGDRSPDLGRYLGTHKGNAECFIAKYLEITKGPAERDRFVEALGGDGFDFTEGFTVEVISEPGKEPRIHISYRNEKFELDEDILPDTLQAVARPE